VVVRATHWITAPSFFGLFISGIAILLGLRSSMRLTCRRLSV
jgi:cytochrome b subunit of formate dehydrogenase